MKHIISFFLLAIMVNTSSFAQIDKIDSLEKQIETTPDSNLFELYYTLVYYYQNISNDKTLEYLEKCLEIATKNDNNTNKATAHKDLGSYFDRLGNDSLSMSNYKEALKLYKSIKDFEQVALIHLNLGNYFWKRSDWTNAAENYLLSLKISEENKDSVGIAKSYTSLAFIYNRADELDRALEYYLKADHFFRKMNHTKGMSVSAVNIGNIYTRKKEFKKAIGFYHRALGIKTSSADLHSLDVNYYNLADAHFQLDNLDSAYKYINKGLAISRKYKNIFTRGYLLHIVGGIHFKREKYDSAYYYYNRARYFGEKINTYEIIKEINLSLSKYFQEMNNLDSAFQYLEMHVALVDSMKPSKAKSKLASYEADKIQAKMDLLEKEKEINKLKSDRRATLLKFAIILVVLILMLFILIYSRYSLKKRTNILLEETNQKLELANQTKNRFFAIISHDLKNNLVAFQNISELLTENFDKIAEEKKHHLLVRLNKSSANLNNILSNLLLWSKSQLDFIDFQPEEFSICELVKEVCQNHQEMSEGKGIVLNNSIEENMQVVADKEMIRVVIRNFLSNAIKFSHENTKVRLFCKQEDSNLIFGVEDIGQGISEEKLKNLFRIQENIHHKNKQMGSGLGLIICKDFIERHKGKIWVESEENKGSTFYFSIPTE
jgi:signal transduction histidine kinase